MQRLLRLLRIVDKTNQSVGESFSFLVYALIIVVAIEVTLRYVFDSPTDWVHDVSAQLFAASVVLGGGYVLFYRGHVNMDIFLIRMWPKTRAIVNLITYLFFFAFCAVLIWKGIDGAALAIRLKEMTITPTPIPVYPLKTLIPIGASLLFLQGLANYIREILILIGKEKG